jgi:hypothetical protein
MTDKKDENSKAAPGQPRPGSSTGDPKRPHAVLDLKATEVKAPGDASKAAETAKDSKLAAGTTFAAAAAAAAATSSSTASPPTKPSDAKPTDAKPTDAKPSATASSAAKTADTAKPAVTTTTPPPRAVPPTPARSGAGFFSHLAAGVIGAVLALAGVQALPMLGVDLGTVPPDVTNRIIALEKSSRPAPADAAQKLAAAEARLAKLEDAAQALSTGQAAVASETKSLDAKFAAFGTAPNYTERLAKMEEQLLSIVATAVTDPKNAGRIPQLAQITAKVGDLETALTTRTAALRKEMTQDLDQRFTRADEQAEAARARLAARTQSLEQSLKSVSDESGLLRTSVDSLKADLDTRMKTAAKPADVQAAVAPFATQLSSLEQNIQGIVKSEKDRNATAGNILLSLELANLKRALDRGGKYESELNSVKKLAGAKLDLTTLETQQKIGVPSLATLGTELRGLAHTMLDAEAEPADATVTDRMLSGFKSIVRVRKTSFSPDDKGTEATIARMEAALKESRLGDTIEEAKKLPPKSAAPAQAWLKRIENRFAIDKALADLEASLKTSLAGGAEPKKGTN